MKNINWKRNLLSISFLLIMGMFISYFPYTSEAGSDNNWYLTLSTGFQSREKSEETETTYTDFENGLNFNAALGYRLPILNKILRIEEEVSLYENKAKELVANGIGVGEEADGSITIHALMTNLYVDVPLKYKVKPYIGAGFGMYKAQINSLTNSVMIALPYDPPNYLPGPIAVNAGSELYSVYQVMAGVNYELSEKVDLYGDYRFFKGDNLKLNVNGAGLGTLKPSGPEINTFRLGFRTNF